MSETIKAISRESILNMSGCYLLQREVDYVLENSRFKIGRSQNVKSRMKCAEYRNAKVISVYYMNDIVKCENELISVFSDKYAQISVSKDSGSYGRETFEGNIDDIVKDFKRICLKHQRKTTDNVMNATTREESEDTTNDDEDLDETEEIVDDSIRNQITKSIKHIGSKHDIIIYKYKDYTLNIYFDTKSTFISYVSLDSAIVKALGKKQLINNFMNTYSFYSQLCSLDTNLHKYGNVYLIYGSSPNTVKVERGYKFKPKYDQNKETNMIFCVPVEDEEAVEMRILNRFKQDFTRMSEDATFAYTNINTVKKTFKSALGSEEKLISNSINPHVKTISVNGKYSSWLSQLATKVIIRNYIKNQDNREDLCQFINVIASDLKDLKKSMLSEEYNIQMNTKCYYWKFHNYVIIQNENNNYINGSRLYNSIIHVDKIKTCMNFTHYLKSDPVQRMKRRFEEEYPDMEFHTKMVQNKEQPWLSGIYIHYTLVRPLVEHLDTHYGLFVAELVYKILKPDILLDRHVESGTIIEYGLSKDEEYNKFLEIYTSMIQHIKDPFAFVNSIATALGSHS